MRCTALLAAVAAVMLAPPAAAQSAPATRDDSLAVGRKYVQWVYESQVDSLWDAFEERLHGVIGSKDRLQEELDRIALNFGVETEVIEETVSAKDGNLVYTREVKFDARPDELAIWMLSVGPDGTLKGASVRPKSQFQQQQQQQQQAKSDSATAKPAN
jgi:opacity protein-like surface antigen